MCESEAGEGRERPQFGQHSSFVGIADVVVVVAGAAEGNAIVIVVAMILVPYVLGMLEEWRDWRTGKLWLLRLDCPVADVAAPYSWARY